MCYMPSIFEVLHWSEGLLAVGTGLLDEHSEKDATNQALALSAFLKNISLVDCRYAIAR